MYAEFTRLRGFADSEVGSVEDVSCRLGLKRAGAGAGAEAEEAFGA